jgi:hypothetical protein
MNDKYLEKVDNILKHEVTRAEFLKYIGVALLGMMGVTSFIKNLHKNVRPTALRPTASNRTAGYGKSAYGR